MRWVIVVVMFVVMWLFIIAVSQGAVDIADAESRGGYSPCSSLSVEGEWAYKHPEIPDHTLIVIINQADGCVIVLTQATLNTATKKLNSLVEIYSIVAVDPVEGAHRYSLLLHQEYGVDSGHNSPTEFTIDNDGSLTYNDLPFKPFNP